MYMCIHTFVYLVIFFLISIHASSCHRSGEICLHSSENGSKKAPGTVFLCYGIRNTLGKQKSLVKLREG